MMARTTELAAPQDGNGRLTEAVHGTDCAAILGRHERWLRTIIMARLRDPQAVAEVTQEVALALVKGKSLPQKDREQGPWLYRVAVRQALLYRRKLGRRRKLQEAFAGSLPQQRPESTATSPLAWLLSQERHALVSQALQRLAPRDAQLLLLKYTEDWSYQQIADHLGISHAAVESRLHRARQQLREQLVGLGVVEPNR